MRHSGKYSHTSQSQIPSPAVRGSKTGLVLRRPFAFCCMVVPVYVLSCCGRFAAYVGGAFPLTPPPSPQRPSEAKAWPHPSALPPLALGKPASPRTVHWLAPCIARWFAQRRARRGNAYSVGYVDLVCFCEAWSLRGIVHSGSAFCLSRQRHGAGMTQVRLPRHATAAVCGSCAPTKKPCRTNHPAPAFSLPHTTLSQSQAWSLRALFIVPALPASQAERGRAALLLSRSSCLASHPPQGAP